MDVVVQSIHSRLYLATDGTWVKLNARPATFSDPVQAITVCIQRGLRYVRLVSDAGVQDKERYVYPFGEDPAIKAERKRLRRQLAEHRRLSQERRILLARMDAMQAEAKEKRKAMPFLKPKKPVDGE